MRCEQPAVSTARFRSVTCQQLLIPTTLAPYLECADTVRDPNSDQRTHSLRVRIRTALHRDELTRALAEGAQPTTLAGLSLRSAQLTGMRSRWLLARAMRRTIAEAHKPAMKRSHASSSSTVLPFSKPKTRSQR